jgi:cysteine sulfinate desulfinase/cysteine desulfurase-like protein
MLSSHKFGGPTGTGAFVAASDLMMPKPLVAGGGQEKGHRAGTENLAGIAMSPVFRLMVPVPCLLPPTPRPVLLPRAP